jgi:hypothetical protein
VVVLGLIKLLGMSHKGICILAQLGRNNEALMLHMLLLLILSEEAPALKAY